MELVKKYFPELSDKQIDIFFAMKDVYAYWNARINVISRKDFDSFYLHHVLHSLSMAKFIQFPDKAKIVDIGSGGGFPGIPLAVFFPNADFYLMDSIGKKVKVIQEAAKELNLDNVTGVNERSENHFSKYDYMTARAVTSLPAFVKMTKHLLQWNNGFENQGLYYLKGGNLSEELKSYKLLKVWELSEIFAEEFFETKKLVFRPLQKKS